MANIIREALTATGMKLPLFVGGMSRVGFSVTGTWVGTVAFEVSYDGVNFRTAFVQPFASGTAVSSTTANGSWWMDVSNALVVRATFTRTSGTAVVVIGTSIDASYQDAFLVSTSRYVSQEVTGGATNVITVAAQANRAWRLRTLTGAFSVAAGATVELIVSDGASAVMWDTYVPLAAGPWVVTLPADPNVPGLSGGGVVNTPGNTLVITLAAPGGSVVSQVNAEIIPA